MERKKFCTGCGTKLEPSFKFCPNCGENTLLNSGEDAGPDSSQQKRTDTPPDKNISPQTRKLLEEFDLQFKALEQQQGKPKKALIPQLAPGTPAGDTYRNIMIGVAAVSLIVAMAVLMFMKNYMVVTIEAMKKSSGY